MSFCTFFYLSLSLSSSLKKTFLAGSQQGWIGVALIQSASSFLVSLFGGLSSQMAWWQRNCKRIEWGLPPKKRKAHRHSPAVTHMVTHTHTLDFFYPMSLTRFRMSPVEQCFWRCKTPVKTRHQLLYDILYKIHTFLKFY